MLSRDIKADCQIHLENYLLLNCIKNYVLRTKLCLKTLYASMISHIASFFSKNSIQPFLQ